VLAVPTTSDRVVLAPSVLARARAGSAGRAGPGRGPARALGEMNGYEEIDTPLGKVYLPPLSEFRPLVCLDCGAVVGGTREANPDLEGAFCPCCDGESIGIGFKHIDLGNFPDF